MAERPVQRPSKASAKPKRTQATAKWSSLKWETNRAKKYSKPGTETANQGQMDKLREQMELRRQAAQKGDDPRVSELARKTARLEENGETDLSSDRHARVESEQSNRGKKRTAGTAAKQSVFPLDNLLGTRNEDRDMDELIIAFQNLRINTKRHHEYPEARDTEQGQLKRRRCEAAKFTALPQQIKFSMGSCTKETPSANEPTSENAVMISSQWKHCLLKHTTINRVTYKRLKSTWRAQ